MKRTKIVCTIGPASNSKTVLKKLMRSGMNVARLNFSHGTYADHKKLIKAIRVAAREEGKNVAILQDLQGPRIRVGIVPKEGLNLKRGQKVKFIAEKDYNIKKPSTKTITFIPNQYPGIWRDVKKGSHILLSDALIDIEVTKTAKHAIDGVVRKPGVLFSHKGMNIPGVSLKVKVITQKDIEDLEFGLAQDVDYIALSFVRDEKDIDELRRLICRLSPTCSAKIIPKIERWEAIQNFDKIVAVSDGVMIARGDLGIELPPEQIPVLQKEMIRKCLLAGIPTIVATQMLESMISNPRPTRAEISDIANAVIDHADAVMLSGETAVGKFPVEAVQFMAATCEETEESTFDDLPRNYLGDESDDHHKSIADSAVRLAENSGARAMIVWSPSGEYAQLLARHRSERLVAAATPDAFVFRQLQLLWSVEAYKKPAPKTADAFLRMMVRQLKKDRRLKKGDKVVFLNGPEFTTEEYSKVELHTV